MKRLLLGSFLAALAMFIWGFVFWATPVSSGAFESTGNYAEIGEALNDLLPADGAYHVPWYGVEEEQMLSLHEQGPLATIHYRRAGAPMGAPSVMVFGFIHMLITAGLLAFLLRMALPALHTYGQRAGFVALAGVAAAFWFEMADPIWWYQSLTAHLYAGFYSIIAFVIAGLVLAKFVTREDEVLATA